MIDEHQIWQEERLLFKDGLILVIDKPQGLPCHAGPKGGPNLEHYFHHLTFGYKEKPSLAHRLDRDTSGCLILGRSKKALRRLGKLFESGKIKKTYLAIVHGVLAEKKGRIDLPLSKRSQNKKGWWMVADQAGKPAITIYKVLTQTDQFALVELKPQTGRTHQLRVHLSELGHPIAGDQIYGPKTSPHQWLCLHASRITIPLYDDKETINVQTAPPCRFRTFLVEQGLETGSGLF